MYAGSSGSPTRFHVAVGVPSLTADIPVYDIYLAELTPAWWSEGALLPPRSQCLQSRTIKICMEPLNRHSVFVSPNPPTQAWFKRLVQKLTSPHMNELSEQFRNQYMKIIDQGFLTDLFGYSKTMEIRMACLLLKLKLYTSLYTALPLGRVAKVEAMVVPCWISLNNKRATELE